MKKISLPAMLLVIITFAVFSCKSNNNAGGYNIVIKGGHVIDPKNNIDGPMDIAVKDGKIALVAESIDTTGALQVVDATGMYVTPGLIDMHAHVNQRGAGPNPIPADGFTFRVGVTTVVDAGCTGFRTFPEFKKQVIDISQTRVLAFLNIVGEGLRGGPFEQNIKDMMVEPAVECAKQYPDIIVGFKLAHFVGHDWTPILRATEAGRICNKPFMVDLGSATPPLPLDSLFLHYLNPGDIYTHCYGGGGSGRESIVDLNTGQLRPFMPDARKRGIYFSVGHGGGSFFYPTAIPATKAGFYPDVIDTDLNASSMNGAMKNILICMDKLQALGMDFKSVISSVTWNPAQIIKHPELGHLSAGSEADIAILSVRTGKFGLVDGRGEKIETDKKLECQMTVRAGRIVYDLNGIANPLVLPR
ncbi:MAG: amidohydrolase/deacetylase family metallohydrolase [Bacteroidales bacterium]|jgi:dihydroorotase|nr:amidohydrolase/deacetylase family metallohydrolase [Bacteroidales bacterium]